MSRGRRRSTDSASRRPSCPAISSSSPSQAGSGVVRPGPRLVQGGNAAEAGERPLGSGAASGDGKVSFLVTRVRIARRAACAGEFELPAEAPFPAVHEKHNLASPSPVTDGERVYAWFATGRSPPSTCRQTRLEEASRRGVWAVRDQLGPWQLAGRSQRPADSAVLPRTASYLLALDARTGAVRWKDDARQASRRTARRSSSSRARDGDHRQLERRHQRPRLSATGERLWHFDEANRFPMPMPLFHDGIIYTSRGYRSSPFMAIRPGGNGDVAATHVVWKVTSGAPYISSPIHYDGLIYMIGDVGVLTVADAKTGERVYQERIGGVYTASPVAGDGKVYLVSEDGETIVLAAGRTPASFRVTVSTRGNSRPPPLPAAGCSFARQRALRDREMTHNVLAGIHIEEWRPADHADASLDRDLDMLADVLREVVYDGAGVSSSCPSHTPTRARSGSTRCCPAFARKRAACLSRAWATESSGPCSSTWRRRRTRSTAEKSRNCSCIRLHDAAGSPVR